MQVTQSTMPQHLSQDIRRAVQNLHKFPALKYYLTDELPDGFYEFTAADYVRLKANKPGKSSAECGLLGGLGMPHVWGDDVC
jgi:hypothetical protein